GDRTFFGDNWPDRARHWLPTVDHPSDKATVEFIVTAPDHYQVIANGDQIEETNITDDTKLTHWKELVPLPTKVMVIGAARFAVNTAGYVDHIPVTSWVYRQDRDNGFLDYKIAIGVLDYFDQKIAAYPYGKLANVQSKTRYGGMENAGNIFYYENSVNGNQDQEKLIAHEIAHQWFGNSASELNWHHIWLSEGFATYMTDLYLEDVRGKAAFLENLKKERQKVIKYAQKKLAPIVDVSVTDYNKLLNPNSYQKGAWVLHMLRHKLGDELFLKGIQNYYHKYAYANALSEDFQQVMEETSDKKLGDFFKQWLYQAGHPVLKIEVSKRKSQITIRQVQGKNLFTFPLDLEIINDEEDRMRKTVWIDSKSHTFTIKMEGEIQRIIVDPDCWLLFEER
ncbi:MAG: aminopeptidase N, partial [Saprospiraceae bacterium]